VNDKIEGLLASGRALLASGRPRDAAFAFERVLLLAPSDPEARAGLEAAHSATAEQDRSDEEKIRELYRWIYARDPDSSDLAIAQAHLAKHDQNKKVAWEDLVWALLNTKEFLFNH